MSLGSLGKLDWFRCRACGMEFSVERDDDSDEDFSGSSYDSEMGIGGAGYNDVMFGDY